MRLVDRASDPSHSPRTRAAHSLLPSTVVTQQKGVELASLCRLPFALCWILSPAPSIVAPPLPRPMLSAALTRFPVRPDPLDSGGSGPARRASTSASTCPATAPGRVRPGRDCDRRPRPQPDVTRRDRLQDVTACNVLRSRGTLGRARGPAARLDRTPLLGPRRASTRNSSLVRSPFRAEQVSPASSPSALSACAA